MTISSSSRSRTLTRTVTMANPSGVPLAVMESTRILAADKVAATSRNRLLRSLADSSSVVG